MEWIFLIALIFFDWIEFFWLNWDELNWITYGIDLNYVDLDCIDWCTTQYATMQYNWIEIALNWFELEWITIQYNLCLSCFTFSNLLVCVSFVRCVAYSFWLLAFCFVLFFVRVGEFWCLGFDIYERRPIGNWTWTSAADFFLDWIIGLGWVTLNRITRQLIWN